MMIPFSGSGTVGRRMSPPRISNFTIFKEGCQASGSHNEVKSSSFLRAKAAGPLSGGLGALSLWTRENNFERSLRGA
jgi:hypothetical protein